ncbi:hypothetical protein GT2_09_01550 [Parageobacillus thermoglucosidasius NBRC 107763]|nr:hypothetical protein GT2_09_01550 [Parageobacillus thermoglucosidasius NBRC 107763]
MGTIFSFIRGKPYMGDHLLDDRRKVIKTAVYSAGYFCPAALAEEHERGQMASKEEWTNRFCMIYNK